MDISLMTRIKNRLEGEAYDCAVVEELLAMVTDRLCLRLGVSVLPSVFGSIAVDATIKAYRRVYYEGITTEAFAINTSVTFVSDILAEYEPEITSYLDSVDEDGNSRSNKTIRFL